MKTVDAIMVEAFTSPRNKRSAEYMAGTRAALEFRINSKRILNPYSLGTAQADAFFSGLDEGYRIYREI